VLPIQHNIKFRRARVERGPSLAHLEVEPMRTFVESDYAGDADFGAL
jgi:hypothetical protein